MQSCLNVNYLDLRWYRNSAFLAARLSMVTLKGRYRLKFLSRVFPSKENFGNPEVPYLLEGCLRCLMSLIIWGYMKGLVIVSFHMSIPGNYPLWSPPTLPKSCSNFLRYADLATIVYILHANFWHVVDESDSRICMMWVASVLLTASYLFDWLVTFSFDLSFSGSKRNKKLCSMSL